MQALLLTHLSCSLSLCIIPAGDTARSDLMVGKSPALQRPFSSPAFPNTGIVFSGRAGLGAPIQLYAHGTWQAVPRVTVS